MKKLLVISGLCVVAGIGVALHTVHPLLCSGLICARIGLAFMAGEYFGENNV